MADRTVSAQLRLDPSVFIAGMRAARAELARFNAEANRTGRRATGDFEEAEGGAQRLERSINRLLETQREQTRQQARGSEETRRSGEATRRQTDETRRQTGETQRNTQERRRNTQETRRSSDEQRRNSEETRRNTQETEQQRRTTERARDSRGRFISRTREDTQSQDENTRSRDRNRRQTQLGIRATTSAGQALAAAAAAASAMALAETSAAVAVGSFGLLAAPSIAKVVSAQEDLAGNWSTLSDLQRGTALEVRGLTDGYHALAASFEPQALGAFNTALGVANTLLPRFADIAGSTSVDVQRLLDRIGGFATGPEMDGFLRNAQQNAPRALDELGTTFTTTGSLALRLATDLTPVGLSFLSVANGALGMVNGLAHVNPLFAQFAVTALLLRAPITGLIAGVGNLTTRMQAYAAQTRGATLATRALGIATAASPALLVAAGAAMFLWASRASQARSASQRLADTLQIQHQAVGNNLAGYQRLADDLLPRLTAASARAGAALEKSSERGLTATSVTNRHGGAVKEAAEETFAYTAKLEQARTAMRHINSTSLELSRAYGISTDQAQRLATAAGVDLSKAVDKNGNLTFEAAQKIHTYAIAVENARTPTRAIALALDDAGNEALQMKDRVNALTAAFDASFGPSLQAFQATNQLRQGFRDLGEQLSKSKNGMAGNDAESLRLQQQFASQLSTVKDLANATFTKTRSMDAARAAVAQQLPLLYALAGRNREARAQVDALAQSLGINTFQVRTNRAAFVAQAAQMLGSRVQAEKLWQAYQRLTAAQRQGAGALGTYIQRVRDSAAQSRISALRTSGASGAQATYNSQVRAALPVLYALAGRNASARAQVDALARSTGNATGATNVSRGAFIRAASAMGIARDKAAQLWREMAKIKSRNVKINVSAQGLWTTAHDPGRRIPGLATGGPVPAIGPESTRAYDSVPAMLRVDEHVWTPEEVDAVGGHGAMLRMRAAARRGEIQGYATGGPVNFAGRSSPSHDVGTVLRPVYAGMDDLIDRIGDTMAAEWKKFAQSGGSVVAAARSMIGLPYSWGGGGIGGPSYGIGRGAGTFGFDCSGLTQYAWWKGRGIDIGGVTNPQWANSHQISEPRPGALGFPSGPSVHVMLASNRPGYVIQAPYTGSYIQEVPRSAPMWRWPNGAGYAAGGQVRRLGEAYTQGRATPDEARLARTLGLAGDPGGERHVAQIAPGAGPIRVWAEPETGGEAYIPLAASKRAQSTRILTAVASRFGLAVKGMADGGILSYADGGTDSLDLSGILGLYDEVYPSASASDLAGAKAGVKTQRGQVDLARRSLAKAQQSRADRIRAAQKRLERAYASKGKGRANRIEDAREALAKAKRTDAIRAAEARLKKERGDLAAATKKLSDTEKRYQLGRQTPTTKLSAALSLSIKNKGAFIANLTKLSDRGFGVLARELLNMGGTEAEKLAADAVKLSDKSLTGLQGKLGQAKQQQDTLEALPNILTTRSALRGGQVRTWQDLLKATGLSADDLSKAVRLMKDDLLKTTAGKTIWAQMIADGYATGGWIKGRPGTDRVPIRATAGEYMVNAGAARQRAALVEAINAGASDAVLRRLIPASVPVSVPVAGGDGASVPLIGSLNVNHVPGYSLPQDVTRAICHVERTIRYHRRRP
ncbi:NlpC/P60 family protein [Actinomadura luteofluorescens]|uniref:NlpC/P60 family protein n=1 Tax=Actinomadura luteofluorescens TaxID=46163 RepID=UPI003D8BBD8F